MNIKHEIIEPDFTVRKVESFFDSWNHWHQRMEIVYVKEGNCTVSIGNSDHHATAGDIIFIHSGEIHNFIKYSDNVCVLICTFNPSLLQQMKTESVYIINHITLQMTEREGLTEKLSNLFDEIYYESDNRRAFSENIMISDLIKLYSLMARHFANPLMISGKNLSKFEAFQEVLEYITLNYMEKISLEDIALKMNYCPAYISSMFVSYAGVNFKKYIDTVRIMHAVDLLKKTNKTVSCIATECGYENLKTFNNTFKRITGSTPKELRNKNI